MDGVESLVESRASILRGILERPRPLDDGFEPLPIDLQVLERYNRTNRELSGGVQKTHVVPLACL